MKHKIQNSRAVFFVCAVVALAFLFTPAGEAYAQVCLISSDCPSSTPVCSGVGAACIPSDTSCLSGEICQSGTCVRGLCQPFMPSGSGSPTGAIFEPPAGATSFSDIVCKVIEFFSKTILPPLAVLMMLVVGFLFMIGGQMPQKAVAARKTLLYVVAGVVLLLLSNGILGIVADIVGSSSIVGACASSPVTLDSIIKTIAGLVNWFAWFISVFSVAMGLYAGALYLTARGDSAQVLKATKVFSFTIIGIAVAVVSFSIIVLTKTFFGI